MDRFLIEVPHAPDVLTCARVVEVFLRTGSHYLANAEWGCSDGVHKSWIIVECASHEEARDIVPSAYRDVSTIIKLNRFTLREVEEMLRYHGQPG